MAKTQLPELVKTVKNLAALVAQLAAVVERLSAYNASGTDRKMAVAAHEAAMRLSEDVGNGG
jgi:hypothetical protein